MRHGALTLAAEVEKRFRGGEWWDVVFASDMLDLATFLGLAPLVAGLPRVAYFHENQLTYPVEEEAERDLHFAFTNLTTALAADEVWWNSAFHRDSYLEALGQLLARMPDYSPRGAVEALREKSRVQWPGIEPSQQPRRGNDGPLHLVWVARWEHDKDPQTFFEALFELRRQGVPFRLSVLGERYRKVPEVFDRARQELAEEIVHWGFRESHCEYEAVLAAADVVVSTARHEFFGIAVVEAMAAGCRPLLPRRLAYPELLESLPSEDRERYLYDGGRDELVERLRALAQEEASILGDTAGVRVAMERFHWYQRTHELDQALVGVERARGFSGTKKTPHPVGE